METVRFIETRSHVDLSFWENLYDLKLDIYGLQSSEVRIVSIPPDTSSILLSRQPRSSDTYLSKASFDATDSEYVNLNYYLNLAFM
jgi:hypothetical protein